MDSNTVNNVANTVGSVANSVAGAVNSGVKVVQDQIESRWHVSVSKWLIIGAGAVVVLLILHHFL